jgi:hypothetical protein
MTKIIKLPTFKGYTVDYRLREFRKGEYPNPMGFISFTSPQGFKMLQEYEAANFEPCQSCKFSARCNIGEPDGICLNDRNKTL